MLTGTMIILKAFCYFILKVIFLLIFGFYWCKIKLMKIGRKEFLAMLEDIKALFAHLWDALMQLFSNLIDKIPA